MNTKKINTKKLTLLQVLPHLNSGGLVSGAIEVAKEAKNLGWTSIVLSSGGNRKYELIRAGCKLVFFPVDSKNIINIVKNKNKISNLIKEFNVDIIHARSRAPAWSSYWASKKMNIPFITTFHGTYGTENFIKKKYNKVMLKGSKVIAISNFIKNHINKEYNHKENVEVIPRGVDTKIFSPSSVTAARLVSLANKLGLQDFHKTILLPGRFSGWKGHILAIEALALLKDKKIKLILLGADKDKILYIKKLRKLALKLSVLDQIIFNDHSRDMPAYMMLSDLVLSCSTKPEAFGRVILEAQAMGRPIVAFDHGGAVELTKNNENGTLVAVSNVEKLAESIKKNLELSASERKIISKRSIKNVEKKYLTKFMVNKTIKLYKETLKQFYKI